MGGVVLALGIAAAMQAPEGELRLRTPERSAAPASDEQRAAAAAARVRAEALASRASDDPEAARGCVAAYVAAYNEQPAAERADELLWNASRCASRVQPGQAMALLRAVVARYPGSPLVPRALLELGQQEQAIGLFAAAAEDLERFVAAAPKQAEAPAALQDALAIRAGLEQTAQAQADLDLWIRLYGARDPDAAAGLQMAGWSLARDDAGRLARVRTYLKVYGRVGGVDRAAVAEVEAGRLLWKQACRARGGGEGTELCVSEWTGPKEQPPRPGKDGAPAPVTVTRGRDRVCAAALPWAFTADAREPRLAAEAQAHFQRALAIGQAQPPVTDPRRAAALRDALAEARLRRTDAELEALMAIAVPRDLELGGSRPGATAADRERERASLRRFHEFFRTLTTQAAAVGRGYEAVIQTRAPRATVAASGRTAALSRTVAARLLAVPVARGLEEDATARVYCGRMAEQVVPQIERYEAALRYCVERSFMLGELAEGQACMAALERTSPRLWPPQAEIVPAGGPIAFEPVVEGVELAAPPMP